MATPVSYTHLDVYKRQVIRWPFEKTVFFNRKSYLYRVNGTFSQISEEIKERAEGIAENSVTWITQL